jgi:hypothetical protein
LNMFLFTLSLLVILSSNLARADRRHNCVVQQNGLAATGYVSLGHRTRQELATHMRWNRRRAGCNKSVAQQN